MGRLFIILCFLMPTLAFAQPKVIALDSSNLMAIHGAKWQYANQDNPEFALPSYNDSNWKQADASLYNPEDSITFSGICWMRLHVDIDSTLIEQPIALMFSQRGASEVYVDGKLITTYGTINGADSSIYYNPKHIPLVITLDTIGRHLIAVRYALYGEESTRMKGINFQKGFSLRVGLANKAIKSSYNIDYYQDFIIVLVTGFSITLCFLHLLLFAFFQKDKSNLYFSLFCLALGLCFGMAYANKYVNDIVYINKLNQWLILGVCFLPFSLSGLTNVLFSKHKIRFRIITAICAITIVVSFFSLVASWLIIILTMLIVMIEAFVLTLKAIIKKEKGAKIVGVGILFFTLFFLGSILMAIIVPNSMSFESDSLSAFVFIIAALLAILSIPLSMSVYLAWSFASINRNLNKQLVQVQTLSDKTIAQEQEKKLLLENQKAELEKEVAERTSEIVNEKKKSDDLLLNILPEEVAEELKEKGVSEAKYFDHVTVLFTDFVDFTKAGERFTPQELVNELHTCFKEFDRIISKYNIEKIKTIGDAYLAVCGLPKADEQHATKTIAAAIEIRDYMVAHKKQYPDRTFDVRVGVHSGPVVAGIVGVKKFAYDIWGDTVNTAARMESSSEADRINISQHTYELVKHQYNCTYRGEITAKNKGEMRMYFVEGKV